MFTQSLALAAAVLGVVQSLSLLGQARTLKRIGSAREVSLPFLYLAVLSSTAWLLYGVLHGDPALVAVNSVGLTGAATTLITAVRLRVADLQTDGPVPDTVRTDPLLPESVAADTVTVAQPLRPRRQPVWLDQPNCDRVRRLRRPALLTTPVEDESRSSQLLALTS
jgi:uncharacterized protein with PQ loop repeat